MNTIEHLEELLMILEAGRDQCKPQTRAFDAHCRCLDFVTDLLATEKSKPVGCDYCNNSLWAALRCTNCGKGMEDV